MRLFPILATATLIFSGGAFAAEPQSSEVNSQSFAERIKEYAQGHQSFRDCCLKEHEAEFLRLAKEGQTPKTLFIGCSDSRVMPSLITGLSVGDMFTVRNAGNFVPLYDTKIDWDGIAASIQYGVDVLGVTDIIVCGHTHCGAIEGLYADPSKLPSLVSKWIKFGQEAKEMALKMADPNITAEEKYVLTGKISVLNQLEHLISYPTIKKKVEENKIYLHGWYYDIAKGNIYFFDPSTYTFRPLTDALR